VTGSYEYGIEPSGSMMEHFLVAQDYTHSQEGLNCIDLVH
jgi:hypothetical protein